jgi:hypothetical protein
MSEVLREFLDDNLYRIYPLTDASGARDNTNSFTLPSSLITDIYLCAPNLSWVDKTKFYISNILIRRYFIDVELSYDDPAVTLPLGTFKNISTTAAVQSTYDFVPSERQTNDQYTPLFHMTGQIIIGDPVEATRFLGSWSFNQADDEHSTKIVSTRVALGLLNVQYISINGRLFTGNVRLREGSNINMDVDQRTVDGVLETVVTVSASLTAGSSLQLANDADVLNALVALYGRPLKTINGMNPDPDRNFTLLPADCTTIEQGGAHAVVISNPCSVPCCDEDQNIENILESIANLNLRYAQLKSFYDASGATINSLQNKLLVLGSEV